MVYAQLSHGALGCEQCIKFMCTMCTVHNFIKLCTMRQIFLCRLCTKILNMMHKFDEKIVHYQITIDVTQQKNYYYYYYINISIVK